MTTIDGAVETGADFDDLQALRQGASELLAALDPTDDEGRGALIADRLTRSVLRPLSALLGVDAAPAPREGAATTLLDPALEDRLWELTRRATLLRARAGAAPELMEATAALQDLVVRPGRGNVAAQLDELRSAMEDVDPHIRVSRDGPYLVTRAERLHSWLGEKLGSYPQMALCRCGQSSIKPYCDGTHAEVGFDGEKDPKRTVDQRRTYEGQQVTIYDNRATCAHSGFCTERLSSVFRLGEEPFVLPSGGRMDEIVKAVRNCPSGALSFGIDDVEARAQVDRDRPQSIEVSKDGPYRVTGHVPLLDEEGGGEDRTEGSSREHYSLCRCGQSQNKPLCSGMHWYVQFNDPVPDPEHEPTLFEWAGGFPALLRTTEIFYGKYVAEDPLIGPLFARMSPDHPERVASWLSEVFGGPDLYSEQYGDYNRMISHHLGKSLTEDQRARWVSLMIQSANDAGLPNDAEFRAAFSAYLEWGSRIAVENSQPGVKPPPNMPVPRWWWVCNATPATRSSAGHPAEVTDAPLQLPGADDALSFEQHIKGLFRKMDRQSMKFVFDLWSYDDVSQHAAAIAERLRAGSMPCDGAWPAEQIDLFDRWIAEDCPA